MITLIIPFHSDSDRLTQTITRIKAQMASLPIEKVFFSYNGSAPLPAGITTLITTSHPAFAVLKTAQQGIGAGYRQGILHASSSYVLLSASDLPFGFSDLQSALATGRLKQDGATIFFASKLHPASHVSRNSHTRTLFSWCFYLLRVLLFGPSVPRDCQGTVLLPTQLAKELAAAIPDDDYLFTFKISILSLWRHYAVEEVPVEFLEDETLPSNIHPLKTGLVFFWKVIAYRVKTLIKGTAA